MKLTLRKKLLLFSVLLALIPLGIAGRTMITISQDELKSAANDEISATAVELVKDVDGLYADAWRGPLLLVRNAIAHGELVGLQAVEDVADLVWLELRVGDNEPAIVAREEFTERLRQASLDPVTSLSLPSEARAGELIYLPAVDAWLLTMVLPFEGGLGGRPAAIAARIDLERLRRRLADHPFNNNGSVRLIDAGGRRIFDPERGDLSALGIVRQAVEVLAASGPRVIRVAPYVRPSGEAMLGGYAFPRSLDWAVIVERSEEDAYLAVTRMRRQLLTWVSAGLLVAVVGAVVFSGRISRPILEIGRVADQVGRGNLRVQVRTIRSRDEVGDLGHRINGMIRGLREGFQLKKFVSGSTIDAVEGGESVDLGGCRENATVFFSDIRGFTAFSEKVEPEVVIRMLNTYLSVQAELVKAHGGDVDKFVGDELVAVFHGDGMAADAARCAIAIHREIGKLNAEHPDWDIAVGIGINTGDMIMGAMGSAGRMDFTILGDNVNLGARLCSAAGRHRTIVSASSYRLIAGTGEFEIGELEPIRVKGKAEPIRIYELQGLRYAEV
ncbi:MAG: HAMP domain-containing protein [bacterium]|nr:HAMP domain-containing protein [bacterium]